MADKNSSSRRQYVREPQTAPAGILDTESVRNDQKISAEIAAGSVKRQYAPKILTPDQRKESVRMFGGLEHCIDKYFDEHLERKVTNAYKDFQKKQSEEYVRRTAVAGQALNFANPNATHVYASAGELTGKSVSGIMSDIQNRLRSDKHVAEDLSILSSNWRDLYIATYGEDQYRAKSKEVGCDLADFYVCSRVSERILQRMAKVDMPKGAMEYALRNGLSNSFVGLLTSVNQHRLDGMSSVKDAMMKKYADAGFGTKLLTTGISFGMDAATFGGYGRATTVFQHLMRGGFVSLDFSLLAKEGFDSGSDTLKDYEKTLSKQFYGNEADAARYRKSAKTLDASANEFAHLVNDDLHRKVKLQPLKAPKPSFDVKTQKEVSVGLAQQLRSQGSAAYNVILDVVRQNGMPVTIGGSIPEWMLKRSEQANINSASSYIAIAVEMKNKSLKEKNVNGKMMSYADVCQRAVDYAHAAFRQHEEKEAKARESQQAAEHDSERCDSVPSEHVSSSSSSFSQQPVQGQGSAPVSSVNPGVAGSQLQNLDFSGWGNFLNDAGLGGLSSFTGNLGMSIAMLPDVLMGLFTGRNKHLTVDNSLGALAALVGGMFLNGRKHPMLKMLLLGFGGLSLLSKASDEINGVSRQQPYRTYQKVADEPLNNRIANPVMKGNTMMAEIDGVPVVITISGYAVDAYHKGVLPLNTLANNILRSYDEQGGFDSVLAANRSLEMSEAVERSRGLR